MHPLKPYSLPDDEFENEEASFDYFDFPSASMSPTVVTGGALVLGSALAATQAPVLATAGAAAGVFLMCKENPIFDSRVIGFAAEQCKNLYSSAVQFVQDAYQKWSTRPELHQKAYPNVEAAMLDLGYQNYVSHLSSQIDPHQQLLYSSIARNLFNEQFKLSSDKLIKTGPSCIYQSAPSKVDPALIKKELAQIQSQLSKEIDQLLKKQNKELEAHLTPLVHKANATVATRANSASAPAQTANPDPTLQDTVKFCEGMNATSQGIALFARFSGEPQIANQIVQSSMATAQIITGISQIAADGFAAGPVGLVLGGLNQFVACMNSNDDGEAREAQGQQIAILSSQIYALHSYVFFEFGRVHASLGMINTNLIQGFRELHKDQEKIFQNIKKLQSSTSVLQDSVNAVGHQLSNLHTQLIGYVIQDDRKQLQLLFSKTREKIKRPFDRSSLQPEIMATFKFYNVDLIAHQIEDPIPSSEHIARSFSTQLGSAEANIGILLNYADKVIHLNVPRPMADPHQWHQCAHLLIEMFNKANQPNPDSAVIGRQDYKDFKYLEKIGKNWLALINHFKSSNLQPGQSHPLSLLFKKYRSDVKHLISLINQEINLFETEKRNDLLSVQHEFALTEFKKQQAFKFEFRRNTYYLSYIRFRATQPAFPHGNFSEHEWQAYMADRQKEINTQLENSKAVIEQKNKIHESIRLPLFDMPIHSMQVSGSNFMVHETKPDTMPLLSLPKAIPLPIDFMLAELLELGRVEYLYQFEANDLVFTIRFSWRESSKLKPIILLRTKQKCTPPDYLNDAEAAWSVYMGGTYPAHGGHTLVGRERAGPGAYLCAVPTLTTFEGFKNKFQLPPFTVSAADIGLVNKQVTDAMNGLRQSFNKKMEQNLGSPDLKNPLARALLEVDASAKMLIAFISILFRENYKKTPAIWSAHEIMDFIQHYQNQIVYLTHQLEANLTQLESVERTLISQLDTQAEISYTPVRETLKQLNQFTLKYKTRVVEDPPVSIHTHQPDPQRDALQRELGATQAALMLQAVLYESHPDAALHVAQLLSKQGLRFLPPPQEEHKHAPTDKKDDADFYYVPPVQFRPSPPPLTNPQVQEKPQGEPPAPVFQTPEVSRLGKPATLPT